MEWLSGWCDFKKIEGDLCLNAAEGHWQLLKWLCEKKGCTVKHEAVMHFAARGDLGVLQWAREVGCPLNGNKACMTAAKEGHLPVLEWVVKTQPCQWNGKRRHAAFERRDSADIPTLYNGFKFIKTAR